MKLHNELQKYDMFIILHLSLKGTVLLHSALKF